MTNLDPIELQHVSGGSARATGGCIDPQWPQVPGPRVPGLPQPQDPLSPRPQLPGLPQPNPAQ